MNHVTHMSVSRHTCTQVMAHTWMSHGTHMTESWHTHEWVMAHTWMSHGTHMNESWHTHEQVISHTCVYSLYLWNIFPISALIFTKICDISAREYLRQLTCEGDACNWVMSHIRMSHVTHMHESCDTYTWTHIHDLQHTSEQGRDWHTYDRTNSCVDESRIQMSDVTHIIQSCHTYQWVMSRIPISHVTHTHA